MKKKTVQYHYFCEHRNSEENTLKKSNSNEYFRNTSAKHVYQQQNC